jgi:hypothetical protein
MVELRGWRISRLTENLGVIDVETVPLAEARFRRTVLSREDWRRRIGAFSTAGPSRLETAGSEAVAEVTATAAESRA